MKEIRDKLARQPVKDPFGGSICFESYAVLRERSLSGRADFGEV
jgi:hypothetical protein